MDRWLKKLGEGWKLMEDGSYRRPIKDGESLKVVKVEYGWVCVVLLNGNAIYGHFYPSFKQLQNALNS